MVEGQCPNSVYHQIKAAVFSGIETDVLRATQKACNIGNQHAMERQEASAIGLPHHCVDWMSTES